MDRGTHPPIVPRGESQHTTTDLLHTNCICIVVVAFYAKPMHAFLLPFSSPPLAPTPSATFRVRHDPAVWSAVHLPNVNIVQERRDLAPELLACARMAANDEHDALEIELAPTDRDLAKAFRYLPEHPGRAALESDVHAVLGRFRALVPLRSVRLKLHAVHHGQCRKFHADYVPLRLLCTYAGPGTEWVPDDAVARGELGGYDEDIDAANERIIPDASRIRHAGTGDVVLLRGNAWKRGSPGAVHRSPVVRSCADHRLVLAITSVGHALG